MNYSLLWKPRKLAAAVNSRLAHRAAIARAIKISAQRYKDDPNYRLESVSENFAPHPGIPQDDSAILKRIMAAYKKAKSDQRHAAAAFKVSNEWVSIYERPLKPVINALLSENVVELQRMYQNFFRDPCSYGLVGFPVDMTKIFFGERISKKYKKYALADSLHRYHLWKERTKDVFPIEVLNAPLVGNPFGYTIDGTFVRSGADYHHYYSQMIKQLFKSTSNKVVVELGGGFGGLAYYLLRDSTDITYVDFDLPEALALASYYLLKTLPQHTITLYGETEFCNDSLKKGGIFMMPSFEITKMPAKSVAVSFNSYSLAEIAPDAIRVYIEQITRITNSYFLHINHTRDAVLNADDFGVEDHGFNLVSRNLAGWTVGINPGSDEFEFLYARES